MNHLPPELEEVEQIISDAECLYTLEDIEVALDDMANRIQKKMMHLNPIAICVMTGGMMPMGALLKRLNFPLQIDYLHVSRYENNVVGGELKWIVEPKKNLEGRAILLIDDVLDGGVTLAEIKDYCEAAGAASVHTAVLVDKIGSRSPNGMRKADFTGLKTDDRYLFGYGMDYKGYLRNIPGIFALPTH